MLRGERLSRFSPMSVGKEEFILPKLTPRELAKFVLNVALTVGRRPSLSDCISLRIAGLKVIETSQQRWLLKNEGRNALPPSNWNQIPVGSDDVRIQCAFIRWSVNLK